MKKISTLMCLAAMMILFSSSCKKDDNGTTVTKVINVTLNVNESYSYEVPHAGDEDDNMLITGQGSHYLVSKTIPASGGNVVFQYTPAENYIGSDEVVINNQEGNHGKGGYGGHGNCGSGKGHHDDTIIYDFKINVKGTVTRLSK